MKGLSFMQKFVCLKSMLKESLSSNPVEEQYLGKVYHLPVTILGEIKVESPSPNGSV